MQILEDFTYEIHSPFALIDAGSAPISRKSLHHYIKQVTDIVVKKTTDPFLLNVLQHHLEECKHS